MPLLPVRISVTTTLLICSAVVLLMLWRRLSRTRTALTEMTAAKDRLLTSLQENSLLQSAIFDNTFQLQGLLAPDGTLLDANKTALLFVGADKATVIGKKFWDTPWWCHDPDSQQRLQEYVRRCAAGECIRFEGTHQAADGSLRHIDATLKPLIDANGTVVYLIPEGRDVTEQKLFEDHLKCSETTYRGIFDNAPIGIFQSVPAGHLISINTVFATIFGYCSTDEMMTLVHDIPQQLYADAEQRIQIINQLRTREMLVVDDVMFNRKDGTRFCATMYIRGTRDISSGEVVLLDGFIVDTTESRQTLEIMIEHEKMLMISGLAAGMAHEINNPLGIIAQDLQNLERRLSPTLPKNRQVAKELGINLTALQHYLEQREISNYLVSMQDAARRASRIMDNMLQFSRNSGTAQHPAPLFEVLEHALELAASDFELRKTYNFSSINLIRDYTAELPRVSINVTEIEQVLINLLKNAAQALHDQPTDSRKEIRVSARQEDTVVVITLEDNGPGMPEDVRRRIFEPFFTTKEVGRGTGLGLTVSHAIITKNHNGLLTVSSAAGHGCRFTITLPIGLTQP